MRQIKHKRLAQLGLVMGVIASGLFGAFAAPAHAQDSFTNQVIQFPVDTTVEFEFKESHGAYQSSLGIVDVDTGEPVKVLFSENKPYDQFGTGQSQTRAPGNNVGTSLDFLGTVQGGSVQNQFNEFTFQAGKRYAFYLESVSPSGQTRRTLLSNSSLATAFDGSLDSGDRGGVTGTRMAWDDDGLPQASQKDQDFDDFVVEAGGYLIGVGCPPIN